MNWDWYSATLRTDPDLVVHALASHELGSIERCRGMHSYAKGVEVMRGDRKFATVMWGGVNGEDSVHVQASGSVTPDVVQMLRSRWPEHRVSRADSREDYSSPKAWRQLTKAAIHVARLCDVATSTVGDWIGGTQGRSLYLGGESSRVRVCIYEKGRQLGVDPNWVRLEVRVRPTGEGKSALACALPAQLMTASKWTQVLAAAVGVPELEAVRVRDPWVPSDEESAMRWCIQQYGGLLSRKATALGGWAELGVWLGEQREGSLH